MQSGTLTEVDVVISAPLAVHLVHKETGNGFEQQAEDGHPCAETNRSLKGNDGVKDGELDDVAQYRQHHAHEELKEEEQKKKKRKCKRMFCFCGFECVFYALRRKL